MVAVHMGVDQKADRPVAECTNGRHDLLGERSELVVDHHHAIVADGQSHMPTGSLQIVDPVAHLVRDDFHGAVIRLGLGIAGSGSSGEQ